MGPSLFLTHVNTTQYRIEQISVVVGITGIALALVLERGQRAKINPVSGYTMITCGVPQGTACDQSLFLICVTDVIHVLVVILPQELVQLLRQL